MKPTHKSLIAWHVLAACYYFYYTSNGCIACSTGESETYLDLSHTFDDTTIYWVTAKNLNVTVKYNGTVTVNGTDPPRQYWYQSEEISASTHGGTHMDAPCHFARGRWCVSDIPLERLVVPAVVVDISNDVQNNPDVHLCLYHLMEWEKMHGNIPNGSLMLIRTGWSRFWPDPLLYSGTLEKDPNLLKFPSIETEAAKWLVHNRNIVGIGIDTMSIDIPMVDQHENQSSTKNTHTTLLENNIYGLENVNLSEPLPAKGLKAYVMPMKLKDASGAPCRVLVELPKGGMTNGNVGTMN